MISCTLLDILPQISARNVIRDKQLIDVISRRISFRTIDPIIDDLHFSKRSFLCYFSLCNKRYESTSGESERVNEKVYHVIISKTNIIVMRNTATVRIRKLK